MNRWYLPAILFFLSSGVVATERNGLAGRDTYRYYCYQCHGYSGDADTLASSYLNPRPRDFTAHNLESLPEAQMLDAVHNGRPGTAMTSFATVLDDGQILDVIGYIRSSFMSGTPVTEKYHSEENGWINHERYSAAFPFVKGEIMLDTRWEDLDDVQRRGKRLYLSACISCHDSANSADGETVWELRAVSYPRKHFSHKAEPPSLVSRASPYALHDVPVSPASMSVTQATAPAGTGSAAFSSPGRAISPTRVLRCSARRPRFGK
jgi:cytochrome c oxidase cbb3-type subunit 3